MNAFRRVRDLFTFTKNEQRIFFFLALVFLVGAGIKAYRMAAGNAEEERRFDYRQSDSIFQARSSAFAPQATPAATAHRAIDLNRASKRELMQLPGVGESTAARILRYRQAHGPLKSEAELRRVKGIGPKKFEKLRPLVRVGSDTTRHH